MDSSIAQGFCQVVLCRSTNREGAGDLGSRRVSPLFPQHLLLLLALGAVCFQLCLHLHSFAQEGIELLGVPVEGGVYPVE